jgi:hypothetical protein
MWHQRSSAARPSARGPRISPPGSAICAAVAGTAGLRAQGADLGERLTPNGSSAPSDYGTHSLRPRARSTGLCAPPWFGVRSRRVTSKFRASERRLLVRGRHTADSGAVWCLLPLAWLVRRSTSSALSEKSNLIPVVLLRLSAGGRGFRPMGTGTGVKAPARWLPTLASAFIPWGSPRAPFGRALGRDMPSVLL